MNVAPAAVLSRGHDEGRLSRPPWSQARQRRHKPLDGFAVKYVVRTVNGRDPEVEALLIRMQLECLPEDRPLHPKEGYWWIAYTETGVPAAFCSLKSSVRWAETGYLSRAGVLWGHRGKGLQKRLIRVRIARARHLGWQWLLSDTSENPASANSLIACGFKMYEPAQPYGLKTSVYWRRRI